MKDYFGRAAIMLAMLITSVGTWADESGSCGDGVTYYYEEATHTLTISKTGEGTGAITSVSCSHYDKIETVIIEDGVTRIMDYAFYGLHALVTVSISNTVTRIDDKAFEYCYNLANLTIGSGVTYIGCETFACTSLTTLDIPASVRAIGYDAFGGCESLTDLTLHEGLQTIGWDAFYGCKSLADIKIPNSVTDIGGQAFWDTAWFNAQPDGMVCLDDWLIGFKGDDQPLTIPLPDKTFTKIAGRAFCYAKNDGDGSYLTTHDIVSVTIPSCVTIISRGAFQGCRADNVYCFADPATLTWDTRNRRLITSDDALWGLAYQECENFKTYGTTTKFHVADASAWSAKFPDANATFVGDLSTALGGNCGATGHAEDVTWSYDFYSRTLTVSGSGAMADYVMHTDGDKTSSTMYNSPIFSEIETITIESGVTHIGQDAFYNCTTLSTLNIPSTVTSINGFSKCTGLTAVTIPNTVETIDKYAFEGCTGLTTVTIGNGVTTIDEQAFDHTSSLTTLTIGSGVKTIKKGAFNYSGLTTLNIPDNVETLEFASFGNCSNLQTVFIGSGLTSMNTWTFRNATGTSNLADMYCYADAASLTMVRTRGKDVLTNVNFHVYDADAWRTKFYNDYFEANYVGDLADCVFLADKADNTAAITAGSGSGKHVALMNRTLYRDGDWNTLCLPFDVDNFTGTPLEGFTVMELDTETAYNGHVTGLDGTTLFLNFKDASGIEAGKPYIVKKTIDASTIGRTATSGTDGYSDSEGYASLVDNDSGTKWCSRTTLSLTRTWICEFTTASLVKVTGYTLTTGDDTNSYQDRNPQKWKLDAKLNEGDAWTTIDSRDVTANASDALPTANTTESQVYAIAAEKQGRYQYFCFEVLQSGSKEMQLAELTLQGYTPETDIFSPTFSDVTINAAAPTAVTSEDGKVSFTGSYSPVSFTANDKTKLFVGADNKLHWPNANMTLGACRAYFDLGTANASEFVLNFDGEEDNTTGIIEVKEVNASLGINDNSWYTLSGTRLDKQPTEKGLYIHNGKKIVIK